MSFTPPKRPKDAMWVGTPCRPIQGVNFYKVDEFLSQEILSDDCRRRNLASSACVDPRVTSRVCVHPGLVKISRALRGFDLSPTAQYMLCNV
ncbi:hypothetical protein ElyMa_002559500 [Elysia marginata]|uniref:Uncharacterized protein n=1 Tax=Elysia marginata TaxID=1093978 RepID=A0AAV4GWP2_9GAST|nr:hypothetical protein ElyMa_002559500 [Elysia marginata]